MAKTRLPYASEFRRQMVELVHAGRTPEELAAEFEPTAQSIRNWIAADDGAVAGRRDVPGRRQVRQRVHRAEDARSGLSGQEIGVHTPG